jgi:hypothetical protein
MLRFRRTWQGSAVVFLAAAFTAPVWAQVAVNPTGGGNVPVLKLQHSPDNPILPPAHPPFDQIPPIPMPEGEPVRNGPPDRSLMMHDALAGRTTLLPLDRTISQLGGTGPGSLPMDGAGEVPDVNNGFGTNSPAGALGSFPAAANCKLIMRFTDTLGNQWFFAGSGSMQDPGVVLTASHCVYTRTFVSGGITRTVNNWADAIWVYPGWDGNSANGPFGNPNGNEVIQNFGWMTGTNYIASTDWINNGGFDFDVGLIACHDRSAGSLTGWYGWTWGFDCAFAQGRTYFNYSYPAENCGGGLHTGTTMYFWGGTWDSCPGNQLQLTTTAGCATAVWGGMSGSGAYYFEGSDRRVHAVCSNSNRSTIGRYAKLWDQFSTSMDTFKFNTRGTGFDPEVLRFRTAATVAQAGTSFPAGSNVFVANNSYGDPASQTYTLNVYLSTNNDISAGDTLLATWNYTLDFAPNSGITFNVPGPFIPASVPPGNYWIGVILTAPGDVDGNNNDTDTWDAQPVTITAAAPSNDTCSGVIALGLNAPFYGNNSTAGTDITVACASSSRDVWFSFTPGCSGDYQFTTCGSTPDTVLSIHSTCGGATLACNDDDFNVHCNSGYIRDSWINLALTSGTTYYIRVATFGTTSAGGNYAVQVNFATPAHDNCGSALAVGDGVYPYSNCNTNTDGPSEPVDCNFFGEPNIGSDLWYRYTAPVTGNAVAALCGSGYDTDLAVYGSSCPLVSGTVIACNDDDLNTHCAASIRDSWVTWPVVVGQQYLVRVGGYAALQGPGILTLSSTAGGGCGSADYDCDGDIGTDADIEAFFACLAGNCPAPPCTSSADFDGDGDIGTDADIEAFFRVLAGGPC